MINVNSDLPNGTPEVELNFYVAAKGALNEIVSSPKITVIIGCYKVNTINGSYIQSNQYETSSTTKVIAAN